MPALWYQFSAIKFPAEFLLINGGSFTTPLPFALNLPNLTSGELFIDSLVSRFALLELLKIAYLIWLFPLLNPFDSSMVLFGDFMKCMGFLSVFS